MGSAARFPGIGITSLSQREDPYGRLSEVSSDPTFRAMLARYLAEETPLKAASTQRHEDAHFFRKSST